MATVVDSPARALSADDAIAMLYAAHWAPMVRLAWLLVRDQGLAEDVVQDALVGLHRRWTELDDPDAAVGYLRRSVVNGSRSALRHRVVTRSYLARQGPDQAAASAEQLALIDLGNLSMRRAVDALPRRQREVLVLRYFSGLSEAEIAHALDIAPGTVKAHAHRGLATLRERLGPTRAHSNDGAAEDREGRS